MKDPSTYLGSNITLVKTHNLRALLLSFLHEQRISRIQLARQTGLSSTTITNLISELLEQGIVVEEGSQTEIDHRPVGRPPTALRLVPEARLAVGVHIGVGLVRIAITDLYASPLFNKIFQFDLPTPPQEILARIAKIIEDAITVTGSDRQRIVGIGVGASGLVNFDTGVNILAPNLEWENVPIRDVLHERLNLPVVVDNNVRAMALGEAFFGAGRGINSLAFVYGRVGVGAGFVVNGQVFRGSSAGAGEIGHVMMLAENGERCRCGRKGCLETLVSETVLIREAQKIASRSPGSYLALGLNRSAEADKISVVFEAARNGDRQVLKIIHELACYLGISLANLVNVLNPELILLGGMFAQGHDLIVSTATDTMRQQAFAGLGEHVQVKTTSFGWRAGVIGAAALALTTLFYQQT